MIALLLALAPLTPPEQFFCDDLYEQTLEQCQREVRKWACSKASDASDGPDRIAHLYWLTLKAERAAVCKCRGARP